MADEIIDVEIDIDDEQVKQLRVEITEIHRMIDVLTKNPTKAVALGIDAKSLNKDLEEANRKLADLSRTMARATSTNITQDRTLRDARAQEAVEAEKTARIRQRYSATAANVAAQEAKATAELERQLELEGTLTKMQRERARNLGLIENKPGGIEDLTDRVLDRWQKYQRTTRGPGKVVQGQWQKQDEFDFLPTSYNPKLFKGLEALNEAVGMLNFGKDVEYTKVLKPKLAPEKIISQTAQLLGTHLEDITAGMDTGVKMALDKYMSWKGQSPLRRKGTGQAGLSTFLPIDYENRGEQEYNDRLATKYLTDQVRIPAEQPNPDASKMPRGPGGLSARLNMMVAQLGDYGMKGAAAKLKEMSLDAHNDVLLRAISDMWAGVYTLSPEELETAKQFFTNEVNPKTGKAYTMDFDKKAHPVHAQYMLRRLMKSQRVNVHDVMPRKQLNKMYSELTGEPLEEEQKETPKSSYNEVVNKIISGYQPSVMKQTTSTAGDAVYMRMQNTKAMIQMFQQARQKTRVQHMQEENKLWAEINKHDTKNFEEELTASIDNYADGWRISTTELWGKIFGYVRGTGAQWTQTNVAGWTKKLRSRPKVDPKDAFDRFGGIGTRSLELANKSIELGTGHAQLHPMLRGMDVVGLASFKGSAGSRQSSTGKDTASASPSQVAENQLFKKLGDLGVDSNNKFRDVSATLTKSNTVKGLLAAGTVDTVVKQQKQTADLISEHAAFMADYDAEATRSTPMPKTPGPMGIQASSIGGEIANHPMMLTAQTQVERAQAMMGGFKRVPVAIHQPRAMSKPQVQEVSEEDMLLQQMADQILVERKYQVPTYSGRKKKKTSELVPEDFAERLQKIQAFAGMDFEKITDFVQTVIDKLPTTRSASSFFNEVTSGGLRTSGATPASIMAHVERLRAHSGEGPSITQPGGHTGSEISRRQMGPGEVLPFPKAFGGGGSKSWLDRMFGQEYKVKMSFMNIDEFMKAQETMKGMPGFVKLTTAEYEKFNGVSDDVLHTIEMTGRVQQDQWKAQEKVIRSKARGLVVGGGADADTASLQVKNRQLSVSERLGEWAQKMDKLNWKLVRGQMAMLGMYFSMMSVTNMLGQAWSKLANQVQSLDNIFKGLSEGLAFGGQFESGQKMIKAMLGDTKGLVSAWKNYTGIMGIFSSMMTYIAYKVFTDAGLLHKIDIIIGNIVDLIMNTNLVESIIDLVGLIVDSLPEIISGLGMVIGALTTIASIPGFGKIVSWMADLGIASAILMPVLAMLGGGVQFLSWAIGGLAWAIGIDLPAKWAAFKALFTVGWLSETITAGLAEIAGILTGTGALSIAGILLSVGAGLAIGIAAVSLMVQTGFTTFLADLGKWVEKQSSVIMDILKIFTWPFAMLGTLIIDLVTGQFKNMGNDLAKIVVDAIIAASRLIQAIVVHIPFVGENLSKIFQNSIDKLSEYSKLYTTTTNIAGQTKTSSSKSGITAATSSSVQNITINNQVGVVNTKADLQDTMDAFNKSAKYAYTG